MMTKTKELKIDRDQPVDLPWLPLVTRAVVLRSAIVAVVVGVLLTWINQNGWVTGREPLKLLPLVLVFVTPFVVVAISQVVAERRAILDAARQRTPLNPRGFLATTISHGIPARALAIGLMIGSVNAGISLAGVLLQSGDLSAVPIAPLSQAFVLPLLFGIMSQAISYRRAVNASQNTPPLGLMV